MHPIASYARAAYANGFAASGGPMTERVKAGCLAAIEMAVDNADDPNVLNATLRLGQLEGTWALIFDRRDALHAKNLAAILPAWRKLLATIDVRQLVHDYRLRIGLTEATDPEMTSWLAAAMGVSREEIQGMIRDAGWPAARELVRDAIAAGWAEGRAGALALGAEQAGVIGFDMNIAFHEGYAALDGLAGLWAQADGWLGRMVGDQAGELGRVLAGLTRDGASYEDMVTAASGVLGSEDLPAVSMIVDYATGQALSQGMLDLYAREGIGSVDFLSAGDGKVCPACLAAEKGSPYSLVLSPVPPIHFRCRCTLATSQNLPASLFGQLAQDAAKTPLSKADMPAAFEDRLAGAVQGEDVAGAAGGRLTGSGLQMSADPGWTERQLEALTREVRDYQGAEYITVNNWLRGISQDFYGPEQIEAMRPAVEARIARLDQIFTASPLSSDAEVWRGMRTGRGIFGDRLSGDLSGFEWRETGYGSTSATRQDALAFAGGSDVPGVVLRILAPQGSGAVYIGEPADELLLERGLNFRVVADHGVQKLEDAGLYRTMPVRLLDIEIVPATETVAADIGTVVADGLDAMETQALRNLAGDYGIYTDGVARDDLLAALRAVGARAPELLQAEPQVQAVQVAAQAPVDSSAATDRAATRALARARQAEIDRVSNVADLLAELDSLLAKEADSAVFTQRLDYMAGQGVDADTIGALRQAVDAGDQTQLRAEMQRIAGEHGLTPIGEAGQTVNYDEALHDALGVAPEPGTPVLIVRPGMVLDLNGERIELSRAQTVLADAGKTTATGQDALDAVQAALDRKPSGGITLTKSQRAALRDYESSFYVAINGVLRRNALDDSESWYTRRRVVRIDEVMAQSRLSTDVQVWRGITDAGRLFGDRLGGDLTGFEWRELAYSSTTADVRIADAFTYEWNGTPRVLMQIAVPQDTGGLRISGMGSGSAGGPQAELLLERGLRFRVVADRGVVDGVRQLDVEVVRASDVGEMMAA